MEPNATLEKHFLMEGWKLDKVRTPATLFLCGCPVAGAVNGM